MSTLSFIAVLLCLASTFGFINDRWLRLPSAIGLMVVALAASASIIAIDAAVPWLNLRDWSAGVLRTRDFPDQLLNFSLSFLLFAGALHVDIGALWTRKFTVLLLATVGVALATALFGLGMWGIFGLAGQPVPLPWCLVLGAVLAPTDPVAIAGLLDRVRLPQTLRAVMAGESLFNDGIGVVAFTAALAYATGDARAASASSIAVQLAREVLGGLGIGTAAGWIAYRMMRRIDDYPLEILISLALAAGTYSASNALGTSGPIAVVVAGLVIGNRATAYAMSETTRRNLTLFWSVIDEILNALLFLLLGFEMLSLDFDREVVIAALLALPLAVFVRGASVVAPAYWLHIHNPDRWSSAAVLTWGGLRGGISVALALSLPATTWEPRILFVTYAVVAFTIIGQGLTIESVIAAAFPQDKSSRSKAT